MNKKIGSARTEVEKIKKRNFRTKKYNIQDKQIHWKGLIAE